jgi:hypothetical protein
MTAMPPARPGCNLRKTANLWGGLRSLIIRADSDGFHALRGRPLRMALHSKARQLARSDEVQTRRSGRGFGMPASIAGDTWPDVFAMTLRSERTSGLRVPRLRTGGLLRARSHGRSVVEQAETSCALFASPCLARRQGARPPPLFCVTFRRTDLRRHLWSTVFDCLRHRPRNLEYVFAMTAFYLHLGSFARVLIKDLDRQMEALPALTPLQFLLPPHRTGRSSRPLTPSVRSRPV